ncbi:hypothetical protein FRB95_004598 [Tulasnella sp. JGI-2019a]|nr:hypothetical protein FRB95_004598 [Tulasnella sp. JGI-2019a]
MEDSSPPPPPVRYSAHPITGAHATRGSGGPPRTPGRFLTCNYCHQRMKRSFSDYCSTHCEDLDLAGPAAREDEERQESPVGIPDNGYLSDGPLDSPLGTPDYELEREAVPGPMTSPTMSRPTCEYCLVGQRMPHSQFCTFQCAKLASIPKPRLCRLTGCQLEATTNGYCSQGHAAIAIVNGQVAGCEVCKIAAKEPESNFCSDTCESLFRAQQKGKGKEKSSEIAHDNIPDPEALLDEQPVPSSPAEDEIYEQGLDSKAGPSRRSNVPPRHVRSATKDDAKVPGGFAFAPGAQSADELNELMDPPTGLSDQPPPEYSPAGASFSMFTSPAVSSLSTAMESFNPFDVKVAPQSASQPRSPPPTGEPSSPNATRQASSFQPLPSPMSPEGASLAGRLRFSTYGGDEKAGSDVYGSPWSASQNDTVQGSSSTSPVAPLAYGSGFVLPTPTAPSSGPHERRTGLPPRFPSNPFYSAQAPYPDEDAEGGRTPRRAPRQSQSPPTSPYNPFFDPVGPPPRRSFTGQSGFQASREVRFSHNSANYSGFSNSSFHDVEFEQKLYPTAEHLFQALKFLEHQPDLAEQVRKVSTRPADAFAEAHRLKQHVRSDWNDINIAMMDYVLRLKFMQHADVREELLFTGNAHLFHITSNPFWGIGPNGEGRNELGLALMRLRTDLATNLPSPGPYQGAVTTPQRQRTGRWTGNATNGTPTPQARGFAAPGSPTCRIRGCQYPPFQSGAKYCDNKHRKQAVVDGLEAACILCKEYPKTVRHFCGQRCAQKAAKDAPMILPIPLKDPKFNEIVTQFNKSWLHQEKPVPTVRLLYKIIQTDKLMEDYNDYRTKVESEGNFARTGRSAGNECRRWHGTRRACNIGDDIKNLQLCRANNCALCSIMRKSFQVTLTGTAPGRNFSRFGQGIYTSATSSKSDDYSVNLSTSPYKAMMLTTVVVGRGHKMLQDSTKLQAPPQGYHSVIGEKGGSLNYDEVVVYHNDAIRPAWLVIYN